MRRACFKLATPHRVELEVAIERFLHLLNSLFHCCHSPIQHALVDLIHDQRDTQQRVTLQQDLSHLHHRQRHIRAKTHQRVKHEMPHVLIQKVLRKRGSLLVDDSFLHETHRDQTGVDPLVVQRDEMRVVIEVRLGDFLDSRVDGAEEFDELLRVAIGLRAAVCFTRIRRTLWLCHLGEDETLQLLGQIEQTEGLRGHCWERFWEIVGDFAM